MFKEGQKVWVTDNSGDPTACAVGDLCIVERVHARQEYRGGYAVFIYARNQKNGQRVSMYDHRFTEVEPYSLNLPNDIHAAHVNAQSKPTPELGAKYDGGKLLFRPLMNGLAAALKVVSAVLTYGARKYAEDSWQEVPNGKVRYENALYRHQNDRALEDFDKESGLLHSAHIATNALFILWFEILEHLNKGKTLEQLTTFNDPTNAKH